MQVPFKYIPRDTIVHRLHPLVKLTFVLLTLLLILNPIYHIKFLPVLLIWLGFSAMLWAIARIEISRFTMLLKLLLGTFIFLLLIQGCTYRGGHTVIVKLFNLTYGPTNLGAIKLEGLQFGFLLSLRILTAAAALPLFIMTTTSTDLMNALRKLRLPKVATFMIVSALSFTTLIFEMWASIIDAQKLRAFDTSKMNIITKLRRAYVPIVTPLVLLLFRKANDFQIALETRGFGAPGEPTEVLLRSFTITDALTVFIFVSVFAFCQYLRIIIAAT